MEAWGTMSKGGEEREGRGGFVGGGRQKKEVMFDDCATLVNHCIGDGSM